MTDETSIEDSEDWGSSSNTTEVPTKGVPAYFNDQKFYRSALTIIAFIIIISLTSIIVFSWYEKEIHDALVGGFFTSIGVIGGVFGTTMAQKMS